MYENYEKTIKRLGISTYKVYKETGVSQAVISAWKQGISVPKMDSMKKIAKYLGVDVEFLYGNDKVTDFSTHELTLGEATSLFIEAVSSDSDIKEMSNSEKKEFQNYLLEQAELAYLKYKSRRKNND